MKVYTLAVLCDYRMHLETYATKELAINSFLNNIKNELLDFIDEDETNKEEFSFRHIIGLLKDEDWENAMDEWNKYISCPTYSILEHEIIGENDGPTKPSFEDL